MAFTTANTLCTPFVGRTIKGWRVGVRICISIDETESTAANLGNYVKAANAQLATYINALSDAVFVPLGTTGVTISSPGSTGSLDNAEDSAVFTFATKNGLVAKVSVPAPKASIFLPDNQTVDPSNADVIAFVTYLLNPLDYPGNAVASTKSGSQFDVFLGALRVRHKTRRKLNIWVRSPESTGMTPSTPGI